MKKLYTLIVAFVIVLASFGFSKAQQSMLWEVSGNGLKQSSYIQGTMHMMCATDFQIKPKTYEALAKASKLVLEIDYTNPTELAEMQKMLQADKKLSETLTSAELAELSKILPSFGTTLSEVDGFTPQGLYSLIAKKATPCDPKDVKMFELELLTKAAQTGKTFGGLEKVSNQIKAIEGSYTLTEIIDQLKAGEEYAILAKQMVKAFNDENLKELDILLRDKRFMNPAQAKLMLDNRNINWVKQAMPEMMAKESVLFAVGSGHLWGKMGMIELLRAQGYTVQPIN